MNYKIILVAIIATIFLPVPGSSAKGRHTPVYFDRYGAHASSYDQPVNMTMEEVSSNYSEAGLDTIYESATEPDYYNNMSDSNYYNNVPEPNYYNPYVYFRSIPREPAPPIVFSTQPLAIIKSIDTMEIEEFLVECPMTKASTISWSAPNQENFNIRLITTTSLGVYREIITKQGNIYGNNTTKIYISSSHPFTVTIYSDISQNDKTTVTTPTEVNPDYKIVYINNSDRLYHNNGCPFLRCNKSATTLKKAIEAKYRECYRCAR